MQNVQQLLHQCTPPALVSHVASAVVVTCIEDGAIRPELIVWVTFLPINEGIPLALQPRCGINKTQSG
eukprot:SAG31_NODE_1244_length_9137_cov_36.820978_4_plen_68_part_00